MTPVKPYLHSITSLRGIASIGVVLLHVDGYWMPLASIESNFFIRKAYLLVDFFFILSGFIMAYVYGNSFQNLSWKTFARFMQARFARIYPLHLFSLLLLIGLYFVKNPNPQNQFYHYYAFKYIPTHLLLVHSTGFFPPSWNLPSWSIGTEWWMYTIFPLLVLWLKDGKVLKYLAIAFLALFIYLLLYYPLPGVAKMFTEGRPYTLNATFNFGMLRCFAGFILGMLVYVLFQKQWQIKVLKSDLSLCFTLILLVAAVYYQLSEYLIVIIFLPILLMAAHNTGRGRALLEIRPLIFLGEISYSLYLMHFPVIVMGLKLYNMPINYWVLFGIRMLAILVVSTLSYYIIELPFRNWLGPRKRE